MQAGNPLSFLWVNNFWINSNIYSGLPIQHPSKKPGMGAQSFTKRGVWMENGKGSTVMAITPIGFIIYDAHHFAYDPNA